MIELVISPVITAIVVVLIEECDNIDNGLWVLLLFLLGNAIGLQSPLPFLGKSLWHSVSARHLSSFAE